MKTNRLRTLLALHVLLVVYSASGILSKLAAGFPVFSAQFVLCYLGILGLLGIYAIFWQQIIKRMPLTTAYANRAVAIIWGMVWGIVIFGERLNFFQWAGGVLVLIGVVLYALSDYKEADVSDRQAGVIE